MEGHLKSRFDSCKAVIVEEIRDSSDILYLRLHGQNCIPKKPSGIMA